ncbi:alkaline shock response membrane anchor protein AmaP [Nocardia sp. 2]|uniref:Alkaline shock response membrane anchor protein AmaP n=1 Tax=Nocardia acididurans TaxID=2802282 RepID=A0ABS1M6Z2_9NOCA|nr:alkaline shock response membrane anchor protein AmaP [Nocardia acididurans]MBL1076417.1 alkaline shock response membrane anchor protein AmaP [Nocardia acididurans]
MTAVNRPARLNRVLIGLIGLTLLVTGGALVAAQRGWISGLHRSEALTPGTAEPPRWVFYAVIAAAVVVAFLCLRWLAAQWFRMPRAVQWQLAESDSTGATTLSSAVAAAAIAADIESFDTVSSVTAWLTGPARSPELHLVVTALPAADLSGLRRRILDEAVPRLREALSAGEIPVSTELRLAADRARVR